VCFSIRAFTDDKFIAGVKHRVLKTVVTFDYVLEPGMAVAEKYKAPALESYDEQIVTRGALELALKEPEGVAMESATMATDLFQAMGWHLPQGVTPIFTRW
jgi:hypothetical protein